MYSRLSIFSVGLSLAIATSPALANDDGFIVWDQNIASAVSADLANDGECSASPYAIYSPRCHEQLNLGFDRPINYFTFLDRTALFLYKYHQLKYNQNLWNNAKLRFHVNLKNVYEQEARAGVELRIRFSSAEPRLGLLTTPGIAPAPPSGRFRRLPAVAAAAEQTALLARCQLAQIGGGDLIERQTEVAREHGDVP
jgi:hypothetical protein